MKINELLSILPFYEVVGEIKDIEINSIEMDHRKIEDADVFICIKGFTVDGHDFAKQATDNGAQIIIAERVVDTSVPTILVSDTSRTLAMLSANYFDFPTKKIPLIGITGTNGKTTVTYLLEAIFNQYKKKTGVIGTIQMKIGEKIIPVKNTTPDTLLLQKSFKDMVDHKVDMAIMEVSSHALDLGRVYGCDFDIAIFTNLSQDHLDYHKDMNDYLRVKELLFAQLGNTYSTNKKKFAIINQDDPCCEQLKKSTAQHVITYGCKNKSDVMATNIKLDIIQTSFTLKTPVGTIDINSQLIGMFNIYNMLAASSAAIAANVPLKTIKNALEHIIGVDGRFERVIQGQNFAAIVDYAHTPDSLENVLKTITEFATKNVYVVVGCGGDRDRTKRPLMAAVAIRYADKAIFTSDNPRTEDPKAILDEMTDLIDGDNFEVIINRKNAIYRAIELANDDDIVLIAGKGHETYQEINRVKYDFDDREVTKEAIKSKELN